MSQALHPPRLYRRGPWMRFWEGLRYGGGVGQWSWLVHRVTGIGILIYLITHIIDTFLVVVHPASYDFVIGLYGGKYEGATYTGLRWGFRLGELALIACVLFHAINGLRVIAFDFWPERATQHQKRIFWIVFFVFVAVMLVVTWWVISELFLPPGTKP